MAEIKTEAEEAAGVLEESEVHVEEGAVGVVATKPTRSEALAEEAVEIEM